MKNLVFIIALLLLVSCKIEETKNPEIAKNSVEFGKEIFEGKGNCFACHKVDQKVIGPSVQDISKIYKAQKGDIVSFLKEDAKPIIDPTQYEVMRANFAITKMMSDEELKALEVYIYSK